MQRELLPAARERSSPKPAFLCPQFPCVQRHGPRRRAYVLRLQEVPLARAKSCRVAASRSTQLITCARWASLPSRRHILRAVRPRGFRRASWVPRGYGRASLAPEEVIVLHLLQVLRRYGHEFVGIQETQSLLDQLARTLPR